MDQSQISEYIKCLKNPVYFLNTYGFIFDLKTSKVGKLTCFPFQEDYIQQLHTHKNNIVLKSRQTGCSVMTAGYVAWKLMFHSDEKILVIANKAEGAIRFLDTVRQFLDNVPTFLLPDTRVEANTKKIRFSNGSWIKAVASSEDAGRGEALTMLILDETAFIDNAEQIWMAAGIALSGTNGKCVMVSCVTADTYVFTDKGVKQINDFIKPNENTKEGYLVSKYNVLGKDKLRSGNTFFNNGKHETRKIMTTNSYLEGSMNHKLWACKDGIYDWFKLKDLNVGDYISIQYGHEIWGKNDDTSDFAPVQSNKMKNYFTPKKITKEIAYLIGLYIAEGSSYKVFKKNNFVGGTITITCGDDVSQAIHDVCLKDNCYDGLHHCISSKNFIEYLEYLGFDLSKRAKEKEIPKRLMEMSRENISYMLKGIFDGDGTSRKNRGYVSMVSSSKILIEQIRMLLINFGILTDYCTGLTLITKKVKVTSVYHRIEANGYFSKIFYDKIGFGFSRKQDNKKYLDGKILSQNTKDIIPYSAEIIKKIMLQFGYSTSYLEKKHIHTHKIFNEKIKLEHSSRHTMLKLYEEVKNQLLPEDLLFFEKNVCENLKWNKIISIEESENETYDFSLPETEDFWCHSVIYNGILGHQTPKGTGSLYHKTWVAATKKEMDFNPIKIHWSQHPLYADGLTEHVDGFGKKYVTSPWYVRECERMQHDKVKIAQELDLSFEGSQSLAIENDIITRYELDIDMRKAQPICFFDYKQNAFVDNQTSFWVWETPKEKENFIVSCDVSRGAQDTKADYSTIQVLNADTLEQVAEYQDKIPPDTFATVIYNIGKAYNNAFVVIEANSFGLATCLTLKNVLKYDTDRTYHSKSIKMIISTGFRADKDEDIPGFQTTVKTRPLMISCLGKYMRDGQVKINSHRLLDEFKTFIINGDKTEHAKGYHDDLIFAFGIGLYIRDTEFENVFMSKSFYKAMLDGITKQTTTVDSRIRLNQTTADLDNKIKNQKIMSPYINRPADWQNGNNADIDDISWLYGPIGG